jgi:hypothetical protein
MSLPFLENEPREQETRYEREPDSAAGQNAERARCLNRLPNVTGCCSYQVPDALRQRAALPGDDALPFLDLELKRAGESHEALSGAHSLLACRECLQAR